MWISPYCFRIRIVYDVSMKKKNTAKVVISFRASHELKKRVKELAKKSETPSKVSERIMWLGIAAYKREEAIINL